jgi:hypothetical protein
MKNGRCFTAPKYLIALVVLLFASSALAFGQAGWKTVQDMGFSLKYPADWNYVELGGDDYEGTKGYIRALSPPGETNFVLIIMFFPDFKIDLKAEKLTYKDFIRSVFESFLKEGDLKDVKIEESDAVLKAGKVPAFMVMRQEEGENLKAAMICGDLAGGNAAIIMLSMDLPADQAEAGKGYLDLAEQIMASLAFPE